MADFGAYERLKQRFAARFEIDGVGYLFRKDDRSAPIRISVEEQAGFIAGFQRTLRGAAWGAVLAGAGLALWLGGSEPRLGVLSESATRVSAVAAVVAVVCAVVWLAWTAPWRSLRDRLPSGPAPSDHERRRAFWARVSWGHLAIGVVATAFMLFNAARMTDLRYGWGRAWLGGGALLLVLLTVQGVRKWRFERGSRPDA